MKTDDKTQVKQRQRKSKQLSIKNNTFRSQPSIGKAHANNFIANRLNEVNIEWTPSATSLTRDRAPSHRIPRARRFATMQSEHIPNDRSNTIEINDFKKVKKGVSFPKSQRPEHFLKIENISTPSPASYIFNRFMDDTHYKTNDNKINTKNSFKTVESDISKKSNAKGVLFKTFKNYHKAFMHHFKHRPYQPQNTIQNPAPGHYKESFGTKKKQIRYSFRLPLKKFNEVNQLIPGPGAYRVQSQPRLSLNAKGTMSKSCRTYLTKFNDTPAPNKYEVQRFLQNNK